MPRPSRASRRSIETLETQADPDLVLDVRLVGRRARTSSTSTSTRSRRGSRRRSSRCASATASMPALTRAAPVARHGRRARSSATWRRASPRCEKAGQADEAGASCATRSGSAVCCSPGTGLAVRIRRLQLKDVRRYRELDIDLAPGLTVVRGPNEAGKSTIQRAIELALTRRVTSAAGDLESLRPWDAPPEARSVVTIEFEQDEEDGQQTGTLEKTFARLARHGQPRVRRPVDRRPGARGPGHRGADRHPDRGVLPLDGVHPPPGARRRSPATRRRCATGCRPPSAARTAARAGRARSSTRRSTT